MKPDFDRIKATTDIVRVIERYGIALKSQGKDYVGLCPFHDDHKPSLRVTPGKGLFRCMSCRATGNVIQFVARKENLTDKEAALKLNGSIPGVRRGSALPAPPPAPQVPAVEAAALLKRVATFYA
jgi:DNA primase